MTFEEVEALPNTKVILGEPTVELISPLWVGKWKCKECEDWSEGEPQDLCRFCSGHKLILEEMRNEHLEKEGELPKHIFLVDRGNGKAVYAYISEDGRIVDLDN